MSGQTATGETEAIPDSDAEVGEIEREASMPISWKRVLAAVGGGFLGIVLMQPLLVGVPYLLNLFRTEPLLAFAEFGQFLSLSPSITVAILMFVFGGTVVLPLVFLVVGAFLPPKSPMYARGIPFATAFWTGFVFVFWPGGDAFTVGVFLVVSLLSHWLYGLVLGGTIQGLVGIPVHEV